MSYQIGDRVLIKVGIDTNHNPIIYGTFAFASVASEDIRPFTIIGTYSNQFIIHCEYADAKAGWQVREADCTKYKIDKKYVGTIALSISASTIGGYVKTRDCKWCYDY